MGREGRGEVQDARLALEFILPPKQMSEEGKDLGSSSKELPAGLNVRCSSSRDRD